MIQLINFEVSMNKITTLSEFQETINSPGIHIIKVSADWCGPCRVLKSNIEALDESVKQLFVEANVDEIEEKLTDALNIRNIPIVIVFKDGKEVKRFVGLRTTKEILDIIDIIDLENGNSI